MNRPETIEDTADLVTAAGGEGIAVAVDHLVSDDVRALVERIRSDHGRLDVLVNDIWGGEFLFAWDKPLWEHSLDDGLRLLRLAVDTHIITSHHALPLLIERPGGLVVEVTDGTADYNADRYRVSFFYDLAKTSAIRMAFAQAQELRPLGARRSRSRPAGCARRSCSRSTGSPRRTGARGPRASRTSASRNRRPTSGARSPRSRPTRTPAASAAQSLSSGQLAQVYGFTDVDGTRPDAWRYLVEVQDPGLPADDTGYR